jgi:hypothetical protein
MQPNLRAKIDVANHPKYREEILQENSTIHQILGSGIHNKDQGEPMRGW